MTIGSAEIGVIVQAINKMVDTLTERIIKTETDVAGQIMRIGDSQVQHQKNIELRLDQLVELTKEMAVMRTEASHRDDRIDDLTTQMNKLHDTQVESLKRMHERLDETEKEHHKLKNNFMKAFWIGSGMWVVTAFWFNITAPVKKVEALVESVQTLKEEIKDINAWRFEQIQNQRFKR